MCLHKEPTKDCQNSAGKNSELRFLKEKSYHVHKQEHDGALHFSMDAWTSSNHKAYVTVTVHFENMGKLIMMLLDLVEVTRSHFGFNLTEAFAKILEEFGISDKVYISYQFQQFSTHHSIHHGGSKCCV